MVNDTAPSLGPEDDLALGFFHPLIRSWFRRRVGEPTEIQRLAWPRIAAGEHLLICAPTGSGKTLTAFLWAIQQLLTNAWPATAGAASRRGPRVLYISPLRALNTDIRRNLDEPLAELGALFRDAGQAPPEVRALTRSGDTPQDERRKMLRKPPDILITTPESLNILLTSDGGRRLLGDLETVILDEIHAVVPSKRGTHLITAIERLVPLSGEFQRLALSATVRPLDAVADFVGGYELLGPVDPSPGEPVYRKRRVRVVRSAAEKRYELKVCYPQGQATPEPGERGDESATGQRFDDNFWRLLAEDCKERVRQNHSTLLFANSRRLTEKITRLINDGELDDLAYSHHGSLSREVRSVVERRLKNGELRAIVATSSLELGIDIGALDEVVMVQSPRSLASAVQRVGRAGHGVGEVSRGTLYPTHGRDLVDAAVVARAIRAQDIEEVHPIRSPFDVLAQVIVSMTSGRGWSIDALHARLRCAAPYHDLTRRQLDRVLAMLAGRDAASRLRELRPRISIDKVKGTVKARPGAARVLYMAGGTIADRGLFHLRREDTLAKIGELDEEFVWERSVGDTFTLGAQGWQVRKITHNDVLVAPSRGAAGIAPFWRSDAEDRSFDFAQRAGELLAEAEGRLDDPAWGAELVETLGFDHTARDALLDFLRRQLATTHRLPTHQHVLVERCPPLDRDREVHQLVIHTLWGGTVNRPLSIALAAAWEEQGGEPLEIFQDDDALLLRLPREVGARELFALVDPDHVEALLRSQLESTGFFGARFRVAAGIAMLLPKTGFRTRTPLWLSRQRAKSLLEKVGESPDFPVLVEAWRTCLQDDFDLPHLKLQLARVRGGELPVIETRTDAPSPFAAGLMWRHTNHFMYEDDSPDSGRRSRLGDDVLRELVFASHLRPRLPRQLVEDFRRKIQRLAPGYAPAPGEDLRDWVVERIVLPWGEWRELLAAVARDHGETLPDAGGRPEAAVVASVAHRVVGVRWGDAEPLVVAVDTLPRLLAALGLGLDRLSLAPLGDSLDEAESGALDPGLVDDLRQLVADTEGAFDEDSLAALVAEWLRFHGPLAPGRLGQLLGLNEGALTTLLDELVSDQQVVIDPLRQGVEEPEICDAENLEILLRWLRLAGRPSFEPLPAEKLALFLAHHQGLTEPGDGVDALRSRLEQLFGLPLPAALWESDVLPARLDPYYPAWLDALLQESELCWFGAGRERLGFAFEGDLELYREASDDVDPAAAEDVVEHKAAEGDVDDPDDPDETGTASDDAAAPRPEGLVQALAGSPAGLELGELGGRSGLDLAPASDALWDLAWAGEVTNTTFLAVRKGVENRFEPPLGVPRNPRNARHSRRPGRPGRPGRGGWQSAHPFHGRWRALDAPEPPADALVADELARDRARQLLQRWGIVCRALVQRELPALRWHRIFRALRLLELSGEVLAGQFFDGLRGLQFVTPTTFRQLEGMLPDDAVYWLCAADPVSLCGVEIEGLEGLPPRLRSTTLVYHGSRLALVARRHGGELDIRLPPDHPRLGEVLAKLGVLISREVRPRTSIEIRTINGENAPDSPYARALGQHYRVTREPAALRLWKHY